MIRVKNHQADQVKYWSSLPSLYFSCYRSLEFTLCVLPYLEYSMLCAVGCYSVAIVRIALAYTHSLPIDPAKFSLSTTYTCCIAFTKCLHIENFRSATHDCLGLGGGVRTSWKSEHALKSILAGSVQAERCGNSYASSSSVPYAEFSVRPILAGQQLFIASVSPLRC